MGMPPVVTIGALTFNASPYNDVCMIEGWQDTPPRDAPIIARGGMPGALPGGAFWPKEKYLVVHGARFTDNNDQALAARTELLAQFNDDAETTITVQWGGQTLSADVRLYDASGCDIPNGSTVKFRLPVVQFDPYRYGPVMNFTVGAYTAQPYARTYTLDTAPTPDVGYRTYTLDTAPTPDFGYRGYAQVIGSSPLPSAATIVNAGDATSTRLTANVIGPLNTGEWALVNETTGQQITADLNLIAGQSLYFDFHEQLVLLNGTDAVNSYVRGEWLALAKGSNTIRLTSDFQNDTAYADLTAYSAYQ